VDTSPGEIVRLDESDQGWIVRLFDENKVELGSFGKAVVWRWVNGKAENDIFIGIREVAFAHYRIRQRDGVRVLYEIAVSSSARGRGLGRRLVEYIGFPMTLKTNSTNKARSFYERLGFSFKGEVHAKDGHAMAIYVKVR
jgi:GNAT superfamily N-acetyltransferase